MKIFAQALLIIIISSLRNNAQISWYPTNGPPEGIFWEQVIYNDTIFIGTNEGIYFTSDNGSSFDLYGLENNIVSICFDSNKNIYAGTLVDGVFKKQIKGGTWTSISPTQQILCNVITYHPAGYLFLGTKNKGLYRSSNGGESWEQIYFVGIDNEIVSILILEDSSIYMGVDYIGLLKSTDLGESWQPKNNGINSVRPWSIYKHTDGNLFVGCAVDSILEGGVYLSSDEGENWDYIGLYYATIYEFLRGPGNNMFCSTTNGFFRSTNNGIDWIRKGYGLGIPSYYSNVILNNRLFVGSGLGLYYSDDLGSNFTLSKLHLSPIFTVKSKGNKLYAGTLFRLYSSNNYGENWQVFDEGLDGHSILRMYPTSNGVLLCSCAYDGIYKFSDYTGKWAHVYGSGFYKNFAEDLNGNIYACGYATGIRKSNYEGNSWVYVNTPTEADSIESIKLDSQKIFIGDLNSGVFITENEGLNWNSISTGLKNKNINCLELDNNKNLYAGTKSGLYLLENGSNIWEEINQLTSLEIKSLFFTGDSLLIIGTWGDGVYTYNIESKRINSANMGLTKAYIAEITKDNLGHLIIGAFNSSIYRSNEIITGELGINENVIVDYSVQQNYPNPFNPSTNIQYAISSTQFVTLKVYDLLGREVVTLVNEEKTAGSYEIEFGVKSLELSSGIYFYKLQAGEFVETKKMILLK